jgi:hypothetical protein
MPDADECPYPGNREAMFHVVVCRNLDCDEEALGRTAEKAIAAWNTRPSIAEGARYAHLIPILIEGLKKLPGGAAVLSDWDRARHRVDDAANKAGREG